MLNIMDRLKGAIKAPLFFCASYHLYYHQI
nr:MAG TPA: hypothetical protein [Caudoviricetes sp.]